MSKIEIHVLTTPNPNALKFMLSTVVKTEGASSYSSAKQCGENKLAYHIFEVRGIDKLYFFNDSITVTKFSYVPWKEIEDKIEEIIKEHIESHDPNYLQEDKEEKRRENLPKEIQEIEKILDQHIRPALQADGGDLEVIEYQKDVLIIRYQGACGTCPSATFGTLEAIKGVLIAEFNPEINVYIAPPEPEENY